MYIIIFICMKFLKDLLQRRVPQILGIYLGMYGTDFFSYPRMIEGSMSLIENARYMGEYQKREILFNNAARLFRLDKSYFDCPEEN